MDEDTFNVSVRKVLKKVGITSQREIEQKVRDAVARVDSRGTRPCRRRWSSPSRDWTFQSTLRAPSSSN